MEKCRGILGFTLLLSLLSCQDQDTRQYDVVIDNVLVVDGTGGKPFYGDVLVLGDSIVRVEKDTAQQFNGKIIIGGDGLYLTPGFIDTHAHGDPLKTPGFKNFIAMGATTICLGQDGFSPNFQDPGIWMDAVDSIGPAVNIALFAGHNTLRMLSGIAYDTLPNEGRLSRMEQLLSAAMDAGCWGMSTGLEYTPGYYAGEEELVRLAKMVGEKGGIIMSHIRNEDNDYVMGSLRELLHQGQYCPVHVSHIKVVYGENPGKAQEILELLDSARTTGMTVTADIYPYIASYTGIGILFPDWAKKPHEYGKVRKERRRQLSKFLKEKIAQRNGPEATLIGTGPYKGLTLAAIATLLNKPADEVLMDDIGPYGASGAYFIMDEALQEHLLVAPHINICSDGSPEMRHPRGYGTFARIIEKYVEDKNMLLLENAIYKMTGLPAQTLGLANRGLIKEGFKADLLLFDPAGIRENATFEHPHQLAGGMQYVIINGKIAKQKEELSAERHGRVLTP